MQHGMETAAAHLGGMEHEEMKPMKEMHVKALHDGSYHMMMHHGDPMKPPMEASSPDLEGVHDKMEEHLGSDPHTGKVGGANERVSEGEKNKKQGHEEKPPMKEKKATSEKAEKAAGANEDED